MCVCVTVAAAGSQDYVPSIITVLPTDSALSGAGITCSFPDPSAQSSTILTTDPTAAPLCLAGTAQVVADASMQQTLSTASLGVSASSVSHDAQLPVNAAATTVFLQPKQEGVGEVVSIGEVPVGGDVMTVMPTGDVLSITPGLMQSLVLSQPECPGTVADSSQVAVSQQVSGPVLQVSPSVTCDTLLASTQGSDVSMTAVTSLEPAAAPQLSTDGTLTAAIQSGIPVTIDPSSLAGPVAINQVFVPVLNNTEKGSVIELVPIRADPTPTTQLQPQVSQ